MTPIFKPRLPILEYLIAVAERSKVPDLELRSEVVDLILGHGSNFSTPGCRKINKAAPIVRVIVISSDHSTVVF